MKLLFANEMSYKSAIKSINQGLEKSTARWLHTQGKVSALEKMLLVPEKLSPSST